MSYPKQPVTQRDLDVIDGRVWGVRDGVDAMFMTGRAPDLIDVEWVQDAMDDVYKLLRRAVEFGVDPDAHVW